MEDVQRSQAVCLDFYNALLGECGVMSVKPGNTYTKHCALWHGFPTLCYLAGCQTFNLCIHSFVHSVVCLKKSRKNLEGDLYHLL